jgi:hypothetical protein
VVVGAAVVIVAVGTERWTLLCGSSVAVYCSLKFLVDSKLQVLSHSMLLNAVIVNLARFKEGSYLPFECLPCTVLSM